MIKAECKAKFNQKTLEKPIQKGCNDALARGAAYLRGVARRKVKRRKHKSSAPGQPPIAHSGVFRASILYDLDKQNIASYVGAQRLVTGRTGFIKDGGGASVSAPIPHILEFGGVAAYGMNANWIHKRVNGNVKTKEDIAAYFRSIGKGPIAYGTSPAQADARVGKGMEVIRASGRRSTKTGKMKFKVHPKRYSPVLGKKVYLTYVKIPDGPAGNKIAEKVADTVVEVFGYPATNRPIKIAPRPLMGPSLEESRAAIAGCFKNTIKP